MGAYLKHILECDVVDHKVKDQSGGLKSLPEIDGIGFKFQQHKSGKPQAYLCEVKTHIKGLAKMAGTKNRVEQLDNQFENMRAFANKNLNLFEVEFLFWAPKVTQKEMLKEINKCYDSNNQFINENYALAMEQLINFAKKNVRITDNPFIRSLQIITHIKPLPITPFQKKTNGKEKK